MYNHLLDLRSLYNLVTSDIFAVTYERVNSDEKAKADRIIDEARALDHSVRNFGITALRDWLRKHNHSEMTIRELRDLAQSLGLMHYSRLSKDQLISEIEVLKNGRKTEVH